VRQKPPTNQSVLLTRRDERRRVSVVDADKPTNSEVERRRGAAERLRGLFADVAPGRSMADDLIAERRAEARAEDREDEARRRRRTGH
jgi:hypothetical protein